MKTWFISNIPPKYGYCVLIAVVKAETADEAKRITIEKSENIDLEDICIDSLEVVEIGDFLEYCVDY